MDEPPDPLPYTPDDLFRTAIVFETSLGLLALVLGWILGPDARALVPEPALEQLPTILWSLLYGTLAAVPILVAVELIRRLPLEAVRRLERISEDGIVALLLRLRPAELIVISLCAGVGEELLFRGWMLHWLAGGSGQSTSLELGVGLVASSLAFGMVHPITKLYIFLAAVMGLYFGVLLLVSGNLLVPIAAHAAYDAAQLLLSARQKRKRSGAKTVD